MTTELQWHRLSEEEPTEDGRYLLCFRYGSFVVAKWYEVDHYFFWDEGECGDDTKGYEKETLWAILPSPASVFNNL